MILQPKRKKFSRSQIALIYDQPSQQTLYDCKISILVTRLVLKYIGFDANGTK